MTNNQSQESLLVDGFGTVTVRGLSLREMIALYVFARKKALGNHKAMKWLLLTGMVFTGIVSPKMSNPEVAKLFEQNAKGAALLATRIVELTHDQTGTSNPIG